MQTDTKFLGVILSANLKWNRHIEVVVSKISKNIGIISKVRHLLPQNLTRDLYFTLVHPYITYCNLVWASPNKSQQLEKIMIKQKQYCRIMTFSKYTEHSRPLFVKLSILNVYDTYKFQLLTHVYKTYNKQISNIYSLQYYCNNSNIIITILARETFACSDLQDVYPAKHHSYQGPKLWNSLPLDMRSSPSI